MGDQMNLWIWRHIRLSLPGDWEMLEFSRQPEEGRCLFADRHQFRLEFSWRLVEGPPDFDRMLSDYQSRLVEQDGLEDPGRVRVESWHGLTGRQANGPVSRFGNYLATAKCVVELVFLWPETRDREEEQQILGSVTEDPPDHNDRQRWRAFGLDLNASANLPLRECKVCPAQAQMTFAEEDSPDVVEHFERLGMLDAWFKDTIHEWLVGKVPDAAKETDTTRKYIGTHDLALVSAVLPARLPLPGRAGRRYDAAAWICPADGRLYNVAILGPAKDATTPADLPGRRLACCPAMAAVGNQ